MFYIKLFHMFEKIGFAFDYFKFLKNPFSCLLFKFGLKDEILVKIRKSNYTMNIREIRLLDTAMMLIRDNYDNKEFEVSQDTC